MDLPAVKYDIALLGGGLDMVSPLLSIKPGVCRTAVNFECSANGGYARIDGYERADGNPSPSDAIYRVFAFTTFTNLPIVGDTITGQTSAATAVVCAIGSDHLAVTKTVGTFELEAVQVGATPIGTISSLGASISSRDAAIYLADAADIYRADISAVPGSGAVRGIAYFDDTLYAFRDNAGATACVLHEATASGWSEIALDHEVAFTVGSGSVVEGQTVTQGANSATIKRVAIISGALAGGTAVGRLIIGAPAPGSFAAGAATTSGGGTLTMGGAQTAITFAPGGKFLFKAKNFTGSSSTLRLYGCDGVNRGFEFDGTVLVPITTGSASDTPTDLADLKFHLVWAFGSSLVHSSPGLPYNYSTTDGAGEIAVSEEITGLIEQTGDSTIGTLLVYCRTTPRALYGTSAADWNLVNASPGMGGAVRYSVQSMFDTFAFSDLGIQALTPSQRFGNFTQSILTATLQPLILAKRNRVSTSLVNRLKTQYRVFFDDGTGLYLTFLNEKCLGTLPTAFPVTINCSGSGTVSDGREVSYFGGNDGFVYQLDKGTSFDGEAINASITLTYNFQRSARMVKRYRKAAIEVTGSGYASVSFGYSLGYGSTAISQPSPISYASSFQPSQWDAFTWDAFTWDGASLMPTEAEMGGSAENVAVTMGSGSAYMPSYTLNSLIIHYTPRRSLR